MSGTGLDAQLGIITETNFGFGITPTTFFPLKSETLGEQIDQLVSEAIIPGRMTRDTEQVKRGMRHVAGSIEMDLYQEQTALWMYHILGANASSGAGPFTHLATPAQGTGLGFTLQKGVPDVAGTVQPWQIVGCKVASAPITATVGEPVGLKVDVIGTVTADTNTSLATAAFADNAAVPMSWADASATVDGNAVAAQAWELNINGQFPERPLLGRDISAEPLRSDRIEASGKVTTEFEDMVETNLYHAGTALDVVLAVNDGTQSMTATVKTVLSGSTPMVAGPGIVAHDLTWSNAFGDGTDTNGLFISTVNNSTNA